MDLPRALYVPTDDGFEATALTVGPTGRLQLPHPRVHRRAGEPGDRLRTQVGTDVQPDVLPVGGERRGPEPLPSDPLSQVIVEPLLRRLDPRSGLRFADLQP